MTKRHGSTATIYLGGYDISGDLSSVEGLPGTADVVEVTGLGAPSAKSFIPGLLDAKVSQKGYFNDTTGTGSDAVLSALVGVQSVTSIYPAGDATQGNFGYANGAAELTAYKLSSPHNGPVGLAAEYQQSGGIDRVKSLQPKLQIAGTGAAQTGTVIDDGASSANGAVAYFHITALDPATTVSPLKVEHSADNVTFAALLTSGLAGTAVGADRQTVAGTVNRYIRRSVTITNAKNATIQVGFKRS